MKKTRKECPYCKKETAICYGRWEENPRLFHVFCNKCLLSTPIVSKTLAGAEKLWNLLEIKEQNGKNN